MFEAQPEMRARVEAMIKERQDKICESIAAVDGQSFHEDSWEREGGGGGRSRVLQGGNVFEKAGCNVSVVMGELSPEAAARMGGGQTIEDMRFWAAGISLVFHPHNPMAPTVHANYRYFERGDGQQPGSWWFGGGADLTPSYLFEEDAVHFHRVHRDVCDQFDASYYRDFKRGCDEYFWLKHRQEARGVGGLFFDNLNDRDPEELFGFISGCAAAFLPAYLPILERRKDMEYGEEHKRWQQLRRGRYVEFNLVWDRGTAFGLRTKGRIESILMSLPLTSRWEYDHHPEEGSPEAELVEVLRQPRDWLGLES